MSESLRSLLPRALEPWLEPWLEPRRLLWLGVGSVVLSVASLLGVPFVLLRLPEDYLVTEPRPFAGTVGHIAWVVARNLLGLLVLGAGLLMLVLPGQGVLTVLVALLLLDFPGKKRLVRFAFAKPRVLDAVNQLRKRAGRAPLRAPAKADATDAHSPQSAG